jgi:hypothetical protein
MTYLERLRELSCPAVGTQLHKPREVTDSGFPRFAQSRDVDQTRQVAELRCLLVELLWDAPNEVEDEIQRTLRDDALDETLAMYRRCYEDYQRIGELIARKAP